MLIGMACSLDRIHIVSIGRSILAEGVKLLSNTKYPVMGMYDNEKMERLENTDLVSDLSRLPRTIHLENYHEISLEKAGRHPRYF